MDISRGTINKPVKCVVYGPEGIGKTTFASKWPSPLFIDTEQSTVRMDVARMPFPTSWHAMMLEIEWAEQNGISEGFKTLVIDTADWAERMCIEFVCEKNKKNGIEEFGYGKGYIYVREEFDKMLKQLNRITDKGMNVVITAHSMMRKFELPDEAGSFDRWELKLNKNVAPLLKEWSDMLLFANFETVTVKTADGKTKGTKGTERVMMTSHHACWDAKNRFGLEPRLPFTFESIQQCLIPEKTGNTPKPVQETAKPEPKPEPKPERKIDQVRALMAKANITEDEIRKLVSAKGKMPYEMRIDDYPDDFIDQWLLRFWDNVSEAIISDPEHLPF